MTYVFVFVGEFGYELFNWHAVVRKFTSLRPAADVVCCSRGDVRPLYDGGRYVDIGEVAAFRDSIANMYYADPHERPSPKEARAFERRLRREIEAHVRETLGMPRRRIGRQALDFVFSSQGRVLDGCRFGIDRFDAAPGTGDIYEGLDLENNLFRRIVPAREQLPGLEERAGFPLDEPFVLVQSRQRDIGARSDALIDEAAIVATLAKRTRVVWLGFTTGRKLDSYSEPATTEGVHTLTIGSFAEQSCLIDKASACVFFTTGDFGSHLYVPPFLGRDVLAVTPRDVLEIGTAPIAFWNENVFRFGGRLEPVVAETLAEPAAREAFADAVAERIPR